MMTLMTVMAMAAGVLRVLLVVLTCVLVAAAAALSPDRTRNLYTGPAGAAAAVTRGHDVGKHLLIIQGLKIETRWLDSMENIEL